jgi:ABC-type uncharacterized transport system permease subunit
VPPLFPATLVLYAVSAGLFWAHLWEPQVARVARFALALSVLAHACDIGWLCWHGQHPMVSAREALSFFSWLTCIAFSVVTLRVPMPALGALIVPVTIVLDLAARLVPSVESHRANSLIRLFHVMLATSGIALFAVAAGGAVVYLAVENSLKAHRPGLLFRHGPALETLDSLNRRCILFGFPIFSAALATGTVWIVRLEGPHGLVTFRYVIAAVAWLLYAGLLIARTAAGWRGRRAAMMTLAGFATALAVMAIYVIRGAIGA